MSQTTLFKEIIKEKPKRWKPRSCRGYGIPYTGCKQRIAGYIFEHLPAGERFVDLFGGGGSMTHYAMLNCSDKFDNFLYNDINPLVTSLFKKAVNGAFNPVTFKPKFITKEEYKQTHNNDGYIAYLWSFGNNNKSYLFGKSTEDFKHKAHDYIVFGDEESLKYLEEHFKDSYYWHIKHLYQGDDYVLARKMYASVILRIEAIRVCVEYGDKRVYDTFKDLTFTEFLDLSNKEIVDVINKYCPDIPKKNYKNTSDKVKIYELKQLEQLEQLERLQHLERLEQLQQLQRLKQLQQLEQLQQLQQLQRLEQLQQLEQLPHQEKLTITNMSYEDFKPQKGDVIYCDIPYDSKTVKYENEFDAEAFFEWCKKQPVPIYYSYYTTGEVLWSKAHRTSNIGKSSLRYEALMKI